jgi:hypothetical protein
MKNKKIYYFILQEDEKYKIILFHPPGVCKLINYIISSPRRMKTNKLYYFIPQEYEK